MFEQNLITQELNLKVIKLGVYKQLGLAVIG
jgi:hypothetical protein